MGGGGQGSDVASRDIAAEIGEAPRVLGYRIGEHKSIVKVRRTALENSMESQLETRGPIAGQPRCRAEDEGKKQAYSHIQHGGTSKVREDAPALLCHASVIP